MASDLVNELRRNWWLVALRGVAAIVFGALAFVWPAITLIALVFLFAAYALVDGVTNVVTGIRSRGRDQRWWLPVLEGVAGIVAGLLAFFLPGITALVLLYIIAAWAVVTGALEIAAAIQLRKQIEGEWLLALSGVASIVFGVLLMILPGPGALALVWLIGGYAIAFGMVLTALAVRLRGVGDRSRGRPQTAPR